MTPERKDLFKELYQEYLLTDGLQSPHFPVKLAYNMIFQPEYVPGCESSKPAD